MSPDIFDLYVVSERVDLTQQGKVIKNINAIKSIQAPMEHRTVATVHSWHIGRKLRRDFNLYSRQIFFRMLKAAREEKNALHLLTGELLGIGEVLRLNIQKIPGVIIYENFNTETIPVRLISRETSFLFRALMSFDVPLARLESAYKRDAISSDIFQENITPLTNAYADLRSFIFSKEWQVANDEDIKSLR
jgi:hypothetical protein